MVKPETNHHDTLLAAMEGISPVDRLIMYGMCDKELQSEQEKTYADVKNVLARRGIDWNDDGDRAIAKKYVNKAALYLKNIFVSRFPPELFTHKFSEEEVLELFHMAAGSRGKNTVFQRAACAILKGTYAINHLETAGDIPKGISRLSVFFQKAEGVGPDGDLSKVNFDILQYPDIDKYGYEAVVAFEGIKKFMKQFQALFQTNVSGTFLQVGDRKVYLQDSFSARLKGPESIMKKILLKPTATVQEVKDFLGIRIVLRDPKDMLLLFHSLKSHGFTNLDTVDTKTQRVNLLQAMNDEDLTETVKRAVRYSHATDDLGPHQVEIEKMKADIGGIKKKQNPHSGDEYRVVSWQGEFPFSITHPLQDSKKIRTQIPWELQVFDTESLKAYHTGESAREEYGERQLTQLFHRVFGSDIEDILKEDPTYHEYGTRRSHHIHKE